jgi:parallel beta-helix repeat protein
MFFVEQLLKKVIENNSTNNIGLGNYYGWRRGGKLRRFLSGAIMILVLFSLMTSAINIQLVKTSPSPTTIIVPDDYLTIQEAINNANERDTIFVRNGTYHEHVLVDKTVSLTGENKNTTIIDGNQAGTVVTVTADNVSINGFTIQNGEIGLDLNSNGNTVTSNIFSFNGAQETDLKTNLEIYPEPPSVPIWLFLYDLIDSGYTEFLDLTTDTPLLEIEVIGHSDVAELCLGLFYDENMDGVPQLNEYVGFASRDKVTWITIPNPAKGRYIIKVQGWNVLGNPGHFDREIIKYNGYGICTYQTFNNTISQNLIVDNNGGIYLQSCSNIVVHSNNITRNWGGIIVGDIVDSIIDSNQANGNNQTVCLRNARNINVTNNVLSNNTFGMHIWNSSRINVTENELYSHQGWGIGLILSFDSHVGNNTISTVYGLDGIRLMFSSGNNLTGNNISYCEHSGILLWYDCYNNNAIDNYISHSGFQGWGHGHGVEILLSHNNVFSNNTISFNERNQGIVAIETSNNIFIGNLISSNCIGIQLRSSFGNYVYHNNIIDNWEQQGFDDTGENFWDGGYPCGGNYWSTYTGIDLYSGPDQNETGSDGIGDTAHTITETNQDNYPLMKPYPWDPHDIGITSVECSRNASGWGYNVTINLMMFNYGNYSEIFDVRVYANETLIGEISSIELASRDFAIIPFVWNTSILSRGNYTIKAVADTVLGEIDTADNAFIDNWVLITKIGDFGGGLPPEFFNFDNEVDGIDLALFIQCCKSLAPPEAMYLADLGGGLPPQFFAYDVKVDGLDLALFIACYKGNGPDTG